MKNQEIQEDSVRQRETETQRQNETKSEIYKERIRNKKKQRERQLEIQRVNTQKVVTQTQRRKEQERCRDGDAYSEGQRRSLRDEGPILPGQKAREHWEAARVQRRRDETEGNPRGLRTASLWGCPRLSPCIPFPHPASLWGHPLGPLPAAPQEGKQGLRAVPVPGPAEPVTAPGDGMTE